MTYHFTIWWYFSAVKLKKTCPSLLFLGKTSTMIVGGPIWAN